MLSIKTWEKAKILKHLHLHCKIMPISGFYGLKSAEVNVFGSLVIYRCTSCTIMLLSVSILFPDCLSSLFIKQTWLRLYEKPAS